MLDTRTPILWGTPAIFCGGVRTILPGPDIFAQGRTILSGVDIWRPPAGAVCAEYESAPPHFSMECVPYRTFWRCHFGTRLVPFWHKIVRKNRCFTNYLVPFWHKRMRQRSNNLVPFWHSILYIAIYPFFILALLASSLGKIRMRLRFLCFSRFGKSGTRIPSTLERI